jgi:hypothetical protein
MPRPLQRVRLESGLKLNLNRLARRGFIRPGAITGPVSIAWTEKYTGDEIAAGLITADMSGIQGWFRIQVADLDQRIMLTTRRRHFGGHQWYFVCPYTNRPASVLWKPPDTHSFASRQKWKRQVAYASQFMDRVARGHQGAAAIKSRLCSIGGFAPDEWDLPPKPKWMRWRTYNRMVEKFDQYEAMVEKGLLGAVERVGLSTKIPD